MKFIFNSYNLRRPTLKHQQKKSSIDIPVGCEQLCTKSLKRGDNIYHKYMTRIYFNNNP